MRLFESHMHLDDPQFQLDQHEVIQSAIDHNVKGMINVGANITSSNASIALSEKYSFIYASCGVHPHEASLYDEKIKQELLSLLEHPKAIAVGEIGLDYYYDHTDRTKQKEVFANQLNIAKKMKLPVIIHDRQAHKDCLDIIKSEKGYENSGVFHCYSGSKEMVREIIDLGFYISFTGVVTFKNAKKVIEAVKAVPMDRLLMETDSPYLSPEPYRGKRNEPGNVRYVAQKMANLKEIPYEDFCENVWNNTLKCFPGFRYKDECDKMVYKHMEV